MKRNKQLSLFMALLLFVSLIIQLPITARASTTVRDTVLILDDSGSMDGEPMDKLIESAEKFCESVLNASGSNRVAVITYNTFAELKCDFTNNIGLLQSAIRDMDEYGMTNIYDALNIANNLLSQSKADVKNIVLMSDGLPNEGQTVESGRYDYADYTGYNYANAVYNQAISYHSDCYIYTLGFFHNISGDTKAFATRFMEDLQNAGYYEVNKVEDLQFTFGEIAEEITEAKITGQFKYPSGAKDYSATYYYADEYFYETAFDYNPSLATMSLCLAMSAFGSGEVSSYEHKSINVKNFMEELRFTDFETTKSFTEKPTADSVAAAIGQKKIRDKDNDVYTLVAVAIRGGGYEQEWASNFTIGSHGNHTGFSEAASQVIDFIKGYVANHKIEGNIKLWVTGYSRAAATANLVAGYLDDGVSVGSTVTLEKKDLYAYCFETPAGTTDTDANAKSKYGNIFNIINPNDLVTKVAPVAMGFKRYGIDFVLPTRENKYNAYSEHTQNMRKQYDALESTEEYVLDKFVFKKVSLKHILPGGKKVIYDSEQQMSMSAFLDDLFSKLVYGYIDRALYNAVVEDGIRELCKAIFQDESKAGDVLESTGNKMKDNAGGLLWEFLWDEYGAYETIAGYLTDSLKEHGATNFDDGEIKKAAQPLLDLVIACLANNINHFVTIIDNHSYFASAHYPELCLAWLQSMDDNYTTEAGLAFSSGSYRIIRINCPVDINVYDPLGALVATVSNEQGKQSVSNGINALVNSDNEKIIYLPADAEFKLEIIGTDSGTVTYSVNEYSYEVGGINRLVNYYDVPIEAGKMLNAVVPAYDATYFSNGTAEGTNTNYRLTDMNGNVLTPNVDVAGQSAINSYYTVNAVSENDDYGTVTGSGVRQLGNYIQVNAVAQEGYTFEGWYINNQKVSSDAEYRFCVREDVSLTAKFIKNSATMSGWIIGLIVFVLLLIVGGIVIAVVASQKGNSNQAHKETKICNANKIGQNTIANKEKSGQDSKPDDTGFGKIQITSGSMRGFSVPISDGETVYLGKDAKISNIVFTSDYKNVSRMHCSIAFDKKANKYFVTDSSLNGTYFTDRKRFLKGKRTAVNRNTTLLLANDNCSILLE